MSYSAKTTFQIPGTEIRLMPVADIEVGERYRKDYGDLSDLIHSIKTNGLINPITVNQTGDTYLLVAGGRRLEAVKQLGQEEVLVRIFTKAMSELDLRILELAENLQRKEMTWSEQNSLQREIHRLQQEKYGVAMPGGVGLSAELKEQLRADGAALVDGQKEVGPVGGWRMEDTAAMLGVSKSQVQNSIQMADKFDKYKDILGDPSNYKTENDARKAIKVVEETMIRAELAKRAAKKAGESSLMGQISDAYHIGDALEGLEGIEAGSINFAEVDPPYSINLGAVKRDNECEEYNEIPAGEFIILHSKVMRELYRILKDDSFAIYWFGIEPWLETLYGLAKDAGFRLTRIPLIWVKPNGQSLNPDRNLANSYETALILKKGDPILAKPGRTNVFSYTPTAPNKKYHPTQKPMELYEDIYQTFSFEGAKCVSPFLGSGMSVLGAISSRRSCFGWDLSDKFRGGYLQAANEIFLGGVGGQEK